jgi:hypothetical protein
MMCAFSKELVPFRSVNGGKTVKVGRDSGEPVVEDYVILGRDGAGFKIEHQGNGGRMVLTQSHICMASGARFPAGKLLAILHGFVEDVDRASPNVTILELGVWPASLGE